jgi:hypothetical protein
MPVYLTRDGRYWKAKDAEELADLLAKDEAATAARDAYIGALRQAAPQARAPAAAPAAPAPAFANAGEWLAARLQDKAIRRAPSFDDAVKAILATFTVFTGLALNHFLTSLTNVDDFSQWNWWGAVALISLLLRYIIGSAIHLNRVYGGDAPRSHSVVLLFKDFLFLVLFGMIAVYIMEATSLYDFIRRAMLFVAAGFAWSVIDYFLRRFWRFWESRSEGDTTRAQLIDLMAAIAFAGLISWAIDGAKAGGADQLLWRSIFVVATGMIFAGANKYYNSATVTAQEWPAPFWRIWVWLDGCQFLASWTVLWWAISCPAAGLAPIIVLSLLYAVFLLADIAALIKSGQRGLT